MLGNGFLPCSGENGAVVGRASGGLFPGRLRRGGWAPAQLDEVSRPGADVDILRVAPPTQRDADRIITRWHIAECEVLLPDRVGVDLDRKSTRLNSSHVKISYAV